MGKKSVEIELNDEVNLTEMNTAEELERLQEVTEKSGDEVKIGYEINEQGYIVRIIIYVDDESTADLILNRVGECKDILNSSSSKE